MPDVFTKAQRSRVMALIRSSGNASTEMRAVCLLRSARITGWRRRRPVFGKPDFVFPKAKVALFVDGCFWHGCRKCNRLPKRSSAVADFWLEKIQRNVRRDLDVSRHLRKIGWTVLRIKECGLRTPTRFLNRLKALV
jgi:DNA mismatch endonuclease (patch repair protein)